MKKLRYLHCVIDDKFIDGAISLFETIMPGSSDYVFVQFKLSTKTSLKMIKNEKVRMVSEREFKNLAIHSDVIILHSLFSLSPKLITSIPLNIKVAWFAWGYDLYRPNIVPINLYYTETEKVVGHNLNIRNIVLAIRSYLRGQHEYSKALKRIDYFSGVFPYEYDLLKEHFPDLKVKLLDFYYGSKDFFIPDTPNHIIENNFSNVIIGNSNTPSNNHLDVFSYMKHLKLEDKGKVIIPLSYPINEKYKSYVKTGAIETWGRDKVNFLEEYLPLNEYLKIVSNCRIAVYFHERQQASDNVLMQLQYGAKVYMSNTSLMYKYLESLGFYIYNLQNDYTGINSPLSNEQIIRNRELLSKYFSSSKLMERVKAIDDIIKADTTSA